MKIEFKPKHNFKGSHRKDRLTRGFKAIDIESDRAFLDVRFYRPGNRLFCCVWIRKPDDWNVEASGSGFAGGYGYNKENAAFQTALANAGLVIAETDAETAARAIAEFLADGRRFVFVDMWP